MHIDDVKRMQAEKDHLMRHEGKHPNQHKSGIDWKAFEKELEKGNKMQAEVEKFERNVGVIE